MTPAQYINALGLALTFGGAIVSASGVILSRETADLLATPRWDFHPELAAAIFKQSRRAGWGLLLVAAGAALQFVVLV